MKHKQKIGITGAFGYLGSNFINSYCNEYNINCLDRTKTKNIKVNLKKINKIIISNVNDKKKVFSFLEKRKIILYKAGVLGGPNSSNISQAKNFLKNNFENLKFFLTYAEQFKINKIIFDSSEQVYGNGDNSINDLTSFEPNPMNFYGLSKLGSEKLLLDWSLKNGTSVDILRYPRIVGSGSYGVLSKMANDALNKNKIYINDSPDKRISLIHINDVIDANRKTIKETNTGYRIFNICNNANNISLIDLAKKIRGKIGNKINIIVDKKKKNFI